MSVFTDDTPCLAINMVGYEHRLEHLRKQLDSVGAKNKITKVEAVVGKDLSLQEKMKYGIARRALFFPDSAFGCALSHRKCWKMAAESIHPATIVFEDDAEFCSHVDRARAWQDMQDTVNNIGDFDVCMLGHYQAVEERTPRSFAGGKAFRCQDFHGSHAYILTREGARKLLAAFPKVSNHSDVAIVECGQKKQIELVGLRPSMIRQKMADSSQSTSRPHVLKYLPRPSDAEADSSVGMDFSLRFPRVQVGSYKIAQWHGAVFGAAYVGGLFANRATIALLVGTLVLGSLLLLDEVAFGDGKVDVAWTFVTAIVFGGFAAFLGSMTRCVLK